MKYIIRLYTFPKYNHLPWVAGLNCRSQIRLFCAHSPKSTETSLGYYTCQLSRLQTKDIDLTHRGQFLTDLMPDSNIWMNFSQHISKKKCLMLTLCHSTLKLLRFSLHSHIAWGVFKGRRTSLSNDVLMTSHAFDSPKDGRYKGIG